jgi:hypothetical protein
MMQQPTREWQLTEAQRAFWAFGVPTRQVATLRALYVEFPRRTDDGGWIIDEFYPLLEWFGPMRDEMRAIIQRQVASICMDPFEPALRTDQVP